MFDRHEGGKLAVLVHVFFSNETDTENLIKFESLVISVGIKPVQVIANHRKLNILLVRLKRKKSKQLLKSVMPM